MSKLSKSFHDRTSLRSGSPPTFFLLVAASAKPRPGKISQKNLMSGQEGTQNSNDRASFHEL